MVGDSTVAAGGGRRPGRFLSALVLQHRSPRQWALWRLPRRGQVWYFVGVDVLAVTAVVLAAVRFPPLAAMLTPFALLAAGMLVSAELARPVERHREDTLLGPGVDTPWIFAGVLVLRPGLAVALVVLSALHQWFRVRRKPVHRQVFGAAATALAGLSAGAFLTATGVRPLGDVLGARTVLLLTAAGLVFLAVNAALVTGADGPRRPREAAPGHAFDAAMTAFGLPLAWAVVAAPLLVPLLAGATVVLHRGGLGAGRRDHVTLDPGTGVLTAASWRGAAEARLDRLGGHGPGPAVLLLDLDHFRLLNDRYGGRIGDAVLRAVAGTLRDEVRAADLVGRSGGEEFAVLLPGTGRFDAMAIAERIRLRIGSTLVALKASGDGPQFVGVTVSIGVADCAADGVLADALLAAEQALLRAKAAGRNRTVCAEPDVSSS
ncbi:diguanylate cyclase (GGDEF) domain-containing protein [Amycolatopsis tolypomycina]|uniref:Diguanylate cyclase (GGDEF) domain-containing protein n=1 Tax=Amycolatopsis tolypomycina TaxID=208445 RepID=A0A1H4S9H2_9PSEU|nr:GGDEF domain-containing protein [Amycolatopsis tolypomycina]SEC40762.1 diguanylate cyclase (GGDEF) domain-containing protein [Amycolatopsis tolypomycina]